MKTEKNLLKTKKAQTTTSKAQSITAAFEKGKKFCHISLPTFAHCGGHGVSKPDGDNGALLHTSQSSSFCLTPVFPKSTIYGHTYS